MTNAPERHNRSEHAQRLAEELVSVGTLIPDSFVDSSDKFFFLQGSNIVTVPRIKEVGDSNNSSIDMALLLTLLFRANVISLDALCERYVENVNESLAVEMTEEVKDFIMGALVFSQAACPISSLAHHVMSWRSRSLIPRQSYLDSENLYEQRVYMSAQANPSGSIWDHFDSLIDINMTREETDMVQANVENAVESLIRTNAVYVNVPASMYNQ